MIIMIINFVYNDQTATLSNQVSWLLYLWIHTYLSSYCVKKLCSACWSPWKTSFYLCGHDPCFMVLPLFFLSCCFTIILNCRSMSKAFELYKLYIYTALFWRAIGLQWLPKMTIFILYLLLVPLNLLNLIEQINALFEMDFMFMKSNNKPSAAFCFFFEQIAKICELRHATWNQPIGHRRVASPTQHQYKVTYNDLFCL